MTLTSFLDVKAEPVKPDDTKIDLLNHLSTESGSNVQVQAATDPLQTVEYVELYNHRVAKRRCLCRALAWLLAVFLLLDIAVVLYIGLRMRHAASVESNSAATSTFTCRLRFRNSANDRHGVDRTELITASNSRILVQPNWAADDFPTTVYDRNRHVTLVRSPNVRLCFIKRNVDPWDLFTLSVRLWAKVEHDVKPEHTRIIRLVARQPAITQSKLMSYGKLFWDLCKDYTTYLVEPAIVEMRSDCPILVCSIPCPSGVHARDSKGCPTCSCRSTKAVANDDDEESADNRRKRRSVSGGSGGARRTVLGVDEGVLPGADGRTVHTIDVIEM